MKEKIVRSQSGLNKLIKADFDGLIKVDALPSRMISIVDSGKAEIRIVGNTRIDSVSGSARIGSVSGSARIDYVSGSARIDYVSDSARIDSVYGSARIDSVSGSARIGYVSGSARIGYVSGSARIGYVSGSARIDYVSDSARIDSVSGSARIDSVSDSARIDSVSGSARIDYVSENVQVNMRSGQILRARDNSIVICWDGYEFPKKFQKDKTVQVIETATFREDNFSIEKFIEKYNVEKDGRESIILYKSVKRENDTDFYTGKIKYENGKLVKAPDWNENFASECGCGLHLSPTSAMALAFNSGKIKKCRVKIKDCRTVKNPQYPTKVRCKEVEVLGDYEE